MNTSVTVSGGVLLTYITVVGVIFDEWQKQHVIIHAFSEMKMIAYKMQLSCE
jgi:hypothetical protein